jgi:glycosyltransferase involved in cell wall biosynthesis
MRPDKFHLLHNPVDTGHFTPLPQAGDEAATQIPQEDGSPLVLAVGRFDKTKNFSLLLEAVRIMQPRLPARLALLGEGPERAGLVQQAEQLGIAGRVYMPGYVADPAPWYRRAAVHAVASRCEGFGNTIVESLATGTPVVIAACAGAPADLIGQGQFGTIVPADNAAAMAAALIETIRRRPDPGPLIARAGMYSLEACLDRYEAMIAAVQGQAKLAAARSGVRRAA